MRQVHPRLNLPRGLLRHSHKNCFTPCEITQRRLDPTQIQPRLPVLGILGHRPLKRRQCPLFVASLGIRIAQIVVDGRIPLHVHRR